MTRISRRAFCGSVPAAASIALLGPLRGVAKNAGPVRIRAVDVFMIQIPTPRDELEGGVTNTYHVATVETDVGVRGYAFGEYIAARPEASPSEWGFKFDLPGTRDVERFLRPMLVGKDLFAVDDHQRAGLTEWGGVEHAIWDAIGKIAGQPVYRLLGGSKSSIPVYLTCVWPGKEDQSHVSYREQAEMAVRIKRAGFKAMKIRAWRPKPLDDVEACREIRDAVGPDFHIMVDRTAHNPGWVWDYDTALLVARALERYDAEWLEEPFARTDFLSPARLRRDVDIKIMGGDLYQGMEPYRECLTHDSFDILHVDAVIGGGVLTVRKIAAMAEAFHTPLLVHGCMGMGLFGWLQTSAAVGHAWQELALVRPPLLPDEQWRPALKVVNTPTLFTFRNGEILVPQGPGLGLDLNEAAIEEFRVG